MEGWGERVGGEEVGAVDVFVGERGGGKRSEG